MTNIYIYIYIYISRAYSFKNISHFYIYIYIYIYVAFFLKTFNSHSYSIHPIGKTHVFHTAALPRPTNHLFLFGFPFVAASCVSRSVKTNHNFPAREDMAGNLPQWDRQILCDIRGAIWRQTKTSGERSRSSDNAGIVVGYQSPGTVKMILPSVTNRKIGIITLPVTRRKTKMP